MKWIDRVGNQYRMTWRPWTVDAMHFDGKHWVTDGRARGALIEMKTWLGDKWFVRPDRLLFTRAQLEARDTHLSLQMLAKVERVPCDCGCESAKPADARSAAWNQAASMVRCNPLPEPATEPKP